MNNRSYWEFAFGQVHEQNLIHGKKFEFIKINESMEINYIILRSSARYYSCFDYAEKALNKS